VQRTRRAGGFVAVMVMRAAVLLLFFFSRHVRQSFCVAVVTKFPSKTSFSVGVVVVVVSVVNNTMVTPNANYADVGVSQKAAKQVLLSFFGTIASATFLLVGSSAAFNVVGKQLVKTNKKRTGRKCTLCDGLRFISCGTCKGRGALEWQPIREAEMERVCLCPTCSGTKMSKCLRCVGIGYL